MHFAEDLAQRGLGDFEQFFREFVAIGGATGDTNSPCWYVVGRAAAISICAMAARSIRPTAG